MINVEMLDGHCLEEYHYECGMNYKHAIMLITEEENALNKMYS